MGHLLTVELPANAFARDELEIRWSFGTYPSYVHDTRRSSVSSCHAWLHPSVEVGREWRMQTSLSCNQLPPATHQANKSPIITMANNTPRLHFHSNLGMRSWRSSLIPWWIFQMGLWRTRSSSIVQKFMKWLLSVPEIQVTSRRDCWVRWHISRSASRARAIP